jgi:N-methylhydantoinase A
LPKGQLEVGVDVGGTFTDVVSFGSDGLHFVKIATSKEQSRAVIQGLKLLGPKVKDATLISHATTVATNALLTKLGLARTAFITNRGFRDILEIGRQRRPEVYNLHSTRPIPLVERRHRFTIGCRIGADGRILEPLDLAQASRVAKRIVRESYQSVAICFLNSYVDPSHELAVRDILLDGGFRGNVSISSEVDREYREYERASTTVVNASLVPLMSGYLSRLERSLSSLGIKARVYVMNSDGGMSPVSYASAHPVSAIESGPAAGVLASRQLAMGRFDEVITFDMGGTTAKAGAIVNGEPEVVEEFEAAGRTHSGRSIVGSGYAIRGSFIDLAEVSAGGGTVAWADEGGGLVVGPRSAGSFPGPACYGLGGKEPTVTDANVVLGRLNPRHLLGGTMPIVSDLAQKSVGELGMKLGLTEIEAAEGIVQLVNNNMSKAISIVSVERGRDPREFTMIAFGGSGPIHSCDLADDLGIREVVVPVHAGLFSAYGLLVADLTRTFVRPSSGGLSSLSTGFRDLDRMADEEMRSEGLRGYKVERFVEARYEGQSHEFLLPYDGVRGLRGSFDLRHKQLYGYSAPERLEIVNLRIRVSIRRGKVPQLRSTPTSRREKTSAKRFVWFVGKKEETRILQRDTLRVGDAGAGPCIIEDYDSTLVANPGWNWKVEDFGVRMQK